MGRPSPSSRTHVAKYVHHGWPTLILPALCASIVKSRQVTTSQDTCLWRKMPRYVFMASS